MTNDSAPSSVQATPAAALVYENGADEAAAAGAAAAADVAIVVLAQSSHEGADRDVNITLVQSALALRSVSTQIGGRLAQAGNRKGTTSSVASRS